MKFNAKTYLKLLMVVGLIAVVGGTAGTFASFNATTSNANTFATGTLVLSNSVNGATACLSTGAGTSTDTNTNASCDALFDTSISAPGDTGGGNLELKNEGTIDATSLDLTATCTPGNNTNANTNGFNGSGDVCTKLWITVQEWPDNTYTGTPVTCVYGNAAVTNTCDFSGTPPTVSALATASPFSVASSLTAGSSRFYTVSVKLDPTADNTFQGRKADVSLSWKEAQ